MDFGSSRFQNILLKVNSYKHIGGKRRFKLKFLLLQHVGNRNKSNPFKNQLGHASQQ
jgi:hypothetical protein